MKLTDQQQTAVAHPGNLLLQACPGSGKTRTIVARLIREVEAIRETPFSVACITYTNAAVMELELRADVYLQSDDERRYVISTIHSFCLNEILRPFASRVPGFIGSMKVLTRDRPEFEEIANYAAGEVNMFNLRYADYEAFASLNLDSGGNLVGMALQNEAIRRAVPFFWKRCEALGFVDFSNIIYKTYCLLRDDPEVARSVATRFKAFLLDEFQDTTELQIEILRLIHAQGKSRFFMVGDPAQSIFGFTGARPELIDPFAAHIHARTDVSLSENFRSNPQIVADANRLYGRDPEMTSEGDNKDCTQQTVFKWTTNTFATLTEDFLPIAADLGIPYGKTAVLARNWAQLYPLARLLREFGIPVVGPGARPYRRSRLFALIAEQLCGSVIDRETYDIRQLERTLQYTITEATGQRLVDVPKFDRRVVLVQLMREAEELAQRYGASDWLDLMSERTAMTLHSMGWIGAAQIPVFQNSVLEMKADMRSNKVDVDNLAIEDLGMFASPSRAVRLLTIHNSKGHEYAAAALIGAREGTLPDFRSKTVAEIEGEKRLFYVGVTRAERLLMYISEKDSWNNPPSRFLGANGVKAL